MTTTKPQRRRWGFLKLSTANSQHVSESETRGNDTPPAGKKLLTKNRGTRQKNGAAPAPNVDLPRGSEEGVQKDGSGFHFNGLRYFMGRGSRASSAESSRGGEETRAPPINNANNRTQGPAERTGPITQQSAASIYTTTRARFSFESIPATVTPEVPPEPRRWSEAPRGPPPRSETATPATASTASLVSSIYSNPRPTPLQPRPIQPPAPNTRPPEPPVPPRLVPRASAPDARRQFEAISGPQVAPPPLPHHRRYSSWAAPSQGPPPQNLVEDGRRRQGQRQTLQNLAEERERERDDRMSGYARRQELPAAQEHMRRETPPVEEVASSTTLSDHNATRSAKMMEELARLRIQQEDERQSQLEGFQELPAELDPFPARRHVNLPELHSDHIPDVRIAGDAVPALLIPGPHNQRRSGDEIRLEDLAESQPPLRPMSVPIVRPPVAPRRQSEPIKTAPPYVNRVRGPSRAVTMLPPVLRIIPPTPTPSPTFHQANPLASTAIPNGSNYAPRSSYIPPAPPPPPAVPVTPPTPGTPVSTPLTPEQVSKPELEAPVRSPPPPPVFPAPMEEMELATIPPAASSSFASPTVNADPSTAYKMPASWPSTTHTPPPAPEVSYTPPPSVAMPPSTEHPRPTKTSPPPAPTRTPPAVPLPLPSTVTPPRSPSPVSQIIRSSETTNVTASAVPSPHIISSTPWPTETHKPRRPNLTLSTSAPANPYTTRTSSPPPILPPLPVIPPLFDSTPAPPPLPPKPLPYRNHNPSANPTPVELATCISSLVSVGMSGGLGESRPVVSQSRSSSTSPPPESTPTSTRHNSTSTSSTSPPPTCYKRPQTPETDRQPLIACLGDDLASKTMMSSTDAEVET